MQLVRYTTTGRRFAKKVIAEGGITISKCNITGKVTLYTTDEHGGYTHRMELQSSEVERLIVFLQTQQDLLPSA